MIKIEDFLKNKINIIIISKNSMKLEFLGEKYTLQTNPTFFLYPYNHQLAEILQISNKKPNNYEHIYNNEGQLSWTGSCGVQKFNECPRKAYLSSKRIRKQFSENSEISMAMGTLIHKYVLCNSYNPSELISEYTTITRYIHSELLNYDIKGIVDNTKNKLLEIIKESIGNDYHIKYEEKYSYKINNIPLVQYVDCYAFNKTDNKINVVIIDLKTSSRNSTEPISYWEQLLYYEYNLSKKLSEEFNIPIENITFKKSILWIIYKEEKIKKSNIIKSEKIINNIFASQLIKTKQNITEILNITNSCLSGLTFYISKNDNITTFEIIRNDLSNCKSTIIKETKLESSKEFYNYMDIEIKNAIKVIEDDNISPNFHSCNKNKWGCDYEKICHNKTSILNNETTKDNIKKEYDNFNNEIVNKVLKENIF